MSFSFPETAESKGIKNVLPDLPVRKIYDAGRSVVDMDKFLEILLFTGMQGLSAGRGSIVVKDAEGDFTLRAAIGFSRHEEHITARGGFAPARSPRGWSTTNCRWSSPNPGTPRSVDRSRRTGTRRNRSFRSR